MTIKLPSKLKAQDFLTSPIDPQPGEDYTAQAQIFCASPNTKVNISIIGTDGYTDSDTYTIDGDTQNIFVYPRC